MGTVKEPHQKSRNMKNIVLIITCYTWYCFTLFIGKIRLGIQYTVTLQQARLRLTLRDAQQPILGLTDVKNHLKPCICVCSRDIQYEHLQKRDWKIKVADFSECSCPLGV